MARKKTDGLNKSEEIRQLLKVNPEMPVKEIVSTLAAKGLKITGNLVYFIKGKMKGRKGRKRKMERAMAKVAAVTENNGAGSMGSGDVLSTIHKVKTLASEVGGLKKLHALIEALSE
jgi:hypothetical protein